MGSWQHRYGWSIADRGGGGCLTRPPAHGSGSATAPAPAPTTAPTGPPTIAPATAPVVAPVAAPASVALAISGRANRTAMAAKPMMLERMVSFLAKVASCRHGNASAALRFRLRAGAKSSHEQGRGD